MRSNRFAAFSRNEGYGGNLRAEDLHWPVRVIGPPVPGCRAVPPCPQLEYLSRALPINTTSNDLVDTSRRLNVARKGD